MYLLFLQEESTWFVLTFLSSSYLVDYPIVFHAALSNIDYEAIINHLMEGNIQSEK